MIYKTIEIRPNVDSTGWVVIGPYYMDKHERVKGKNCKPNPNGFYHYWETMRADVAFKRLLKCMLDAHQKEIDGHTKSMDLLKKVTFKPEGEKL